MRLSDVLSKAPDSKPAQVEGFLGDRRLAWGKQKRLQVGKILINYLCRHCGDQRSFTSGEDLYCLGVGDRSVSIDATLKCPGCGSSVEVWFLLRSDGDISGPAPNIWVDRFTENLGSNADRAGAPTGEYADLIKRAHAAYEAGLGAGSMIYVRQVFESITNRVAEIANIAATTASGRRRPFRDILQDVNAQRQIIPRRFSRNGYQLFSELSEAIHGSTAEDEALRKFTPCLQLVRGIVEEVNRDAVYAAAIDELGWVVDETVGGVDA